MISSGAGGPCTKRPEVGYPTTTKPWSDWPVPGREFCDFALRPRSRCPDAVFFFDDPGRSGGSSGVIEIVKRTDSHKFVVVPKRWIVERTFAWLGKYRRLSKDYETLIQSSEAMIRIAMINVMIHKLSPG